MFRHKVRAPVSLLMTAEGHELDAAVRGKTGMSRGDLYELMLKRCGQQIVTEAMHV